MTFSVLCYLCASICGVTDITAGSLRKRNVTVFGNTFFCIFMIIMGLFEVSPCREVIVNPAIVMGPFCYMLIDKSVLTVKQNIIVPLSVFLITAGLFRFGIGGGITVFLYAMICIPAALIMKNPFFSILIVPVFSEIVVCGMELIMGGYTFLELSDDVIGAMQGVGMLTASVIQTAKITVLKAFKRKPVRE